MTTEKAILYLNFLVKEYVGITKLIASTKQRLQSLPGEKRNEEFDTLLKGRDYVKGHGKDLVKEHDVGLETIKGRIIRELKKELKQWDVWETWTKEILGIGEYITAQLILFYYYRFTPICKDCGGLLEKKDHKMICIDCKKVAKEGLLKYRVEYRDHATVSKWWAHLGRHTVDGIMPKRKKGIKPNPITKENNWSTVGRTIGWHIGEEFNRQKDNHSYKALLLLRKAKHQKNHPEWSKGHVHNAAKNEVVKIFLAHWWTVARKLEGKTVSEPYAGALMGHTNIIEPFYWKNDKVA